MNSFTFIWSEMRVLSYIRLPMLLLKNNITWINHLKSLYLFFIISLKPLSNEFYWNKYHIMLCVIFLTTSIGGAFPSLEQFQSGWDLAQCMKPRQARQLQGFRNLKKSWGQQCSLDCYSLEIVFCKTMKKGPP